jgi:hypothetical protein
MSVVRAIARRIIPNALRYERSYANNYLSPKGWQLSVELHQSINNNGPVPWITYPAHMMLERIVAPHHRVFEYGAGNSSLWWARRAAQVVSVEHDAGWADTVSARGPSHLKVVAIPLGTPADEALLSDFRALGLKDSHLATRELTIEHGLLTEGFSAYALELAKYPKGYFDIVVVDGMARVLTAWVAAQYVKQTGFILFDNSDRKQYNDGFRILTDAGFKRIDFYGSGPVNPFEWCTSIFAKEFDWLSTNATIPEGQRSDLDQP